MLGHAREAVAMASGRTRGELDTDRQLNLSLVRLLEIVGEAAARADGRTGALSRYSVAGDRRPAQSSDSRLRFG